MFRVEVMKIAAKAQIFGPRMHPSSGSQRSASVSPMDLSRVCRLRPEYPARGTLIAAYLVCLSASLALSVLCLFVFELSRVP